MSETVILHFRDALWDDVARELDRLAPRHPERSTLPRRFPDEWLYPEGINCITLAEYEDYLDEYAPEDIDALELLLRSAPSCSLCIDFRRTKDWDACGLVQILCCKFLRLFSGLVDDTLGDIWTAEEIEGGTVKGNGKFVEAYRI